MISPTVLQYLAGRALPIKWVVGLTGAAHSTFYQKWLTLVPMGKGILGIAIALVVLGCDADRPQTVAQYCRRVSDQLDRCLKENREMLNRPGPGYPACAPYGRDIEAKFQMLVERPMGPEARRVAGYVHMKAIDLVEHVNLSDGSEARLKEIAAICDGIPETLE
jgi:hypothetical protein